MKKKLKASVISVFLSVSLTSSVLHASSRVATGPKYDIGYYPKGILPLSVFLTVPTSSIYTLTEGGNHQRWVPGLLTLISMPILLSGPPGYGNATKNYTLVRKTSEEQSSIEKVESTERREQIRYLFSREKRNQNYKLLTIGLLMNAANAASAKTEKARAVSWVGAGVVLAAFFIDTSRYFWLTQPQGVSLMPIVDPYSESYGLSVSYSF